MKSPNSIFVVFFLFIMPYFLKGERSAVGIFIQDLKTQKADSVQTRLMIQWVDDGKESQFGDSVSFYYRKIIDIADDAGNFDLQALGYMYLGFYYSNKGNEGEGIELVLKAIKLAERNMEPKILSRAYYIMSYFYYDERGVANAKKSLAYSLHSDVLHVQGLSYDALGTAYLRSGKYDSALNAMLQAHQITLKLNWNRQRNVMVPYRIGNIYMKMKNYALAEDNYKYALREANRLNNLGGFRIAYYGLMKFYSETKQPDSALIYASKFLEIAEEYSAKSEASIILYKHFKEAGEYRKANHFLEDHVRFNDSAYNMQKIHRIESASFSEEQRQQELEIVKNTALKERHRNLQYAAIAIALSILILLFLLLTRSIVVTSGLVKVMGVIALLLIFEFINLLIHPFISDLTHHSPVLMLLAMVAIAALLVPLHHKIEKWITYKLVEKNKRIRLAAAKKTIEQLEGNLKVGGPPLSQKY